MGRKLKIDELGLKELVADKWDGGKKTIVYVTEEVNQWLKKNGYKITVSREGIRRAIKNHEESIADAKKSVETAKAMAEVLKDYPATEASEAMLMQLSSLITLDLKNIKSISFEDPAEMIHSAAKVATSQMRLSNYRMKAITALDNAKKKIKTELQISIQNDSELLERLYKIIDAVEVK